MTTLEPTKLLTLDDATYEVSKMSLEIQNLVNHLDDWREKEFSQQKDLILTQYGLREMHRVLANALQQERLAAEEKARAMGIVTDVLPTEPTGDANV